MAKDEAIIHYEAAEQAARILNRHGFDAYIIGGAVRDLLLGRAPKDFDLVTNATPEQLLALEEFSRAFYKDPAQAFGVTRVNLPVGKQTVHIEIATYRRDIEAHLGRKLTKVEFADLDDDVMRRDLTINALAFDPLTHELIDHVDGMRDLDNKIIRFIGDSTQRIQEDPLRLLRAVRLKNELGFDFDPQTYQALTRAVKDGFVDGIATDRVRDELTRMLKLGSRKAALEDLDSLGILKRLLPEVDAGKGVKQPPEYHSEGDVFVHTLLTMDCLPPTISTRLAWATLLHDIGKVKTYRPESETGDRIRFNEHSEVGAKQAVRALRRLNFSNKVVEQVEWLIHYHIGIDNLPLMRPKRRENFMAHPAFEDLLTLHKADACGSWSRLPDGTILKSSGDFKELEDIWQKFQRRRKVTPPLLKNDLGISGDLIMKKFGLGSGARLGRLLRVLEHKYLDGEIKTRRAALKFAKDWVEKSAKD